VTEVAEAEPRADRPARLIGDLRAEEPGPTLVLVGGVHANEPAGIEAAERVVGRLEREGSLARGRLVALRGNLAALAHNASKPWMRPRYLDEDLNRVFAGESGSGSSEHAQRDELAALLSEIALGSTGRPMLMDLHTFSSDAPAFVAVEDSLPARRFAMNIGLPKILGLEEELNGLLMDFAGNELGYVSCIVESGRHDDPESVRVHEASILRALAAAGMADERLLLKDGADPREVLKNAARGRGSHIYEVLQHEKITDPLYHTADHIRAFGRVEAERTIIGMEPGRELGPESSGLVCMPNRQASPRGGDDGFFVIRRVGRIWVALSAFLRSREWIHAALPKVLPGVRRRPGRDDELLIAPEIAAVLRAQVMHLFGYRLVRRSRTPHLGLARRALLAAGGIVRSLGTILRGAFAGGEPRALPEERPEDWIARRRTLDLPPE